MDVRDEPERGVTVATGDGPPMDAAYERLLGAISATDASSVIIEEARRHLAEARFVLLGGFGSLLERAEQAVAVLERGIHQCEYALNITDEAPE